VPRCPPLPTDFQGLLRLSPRGPCQRAPRRFERPAKKTCSAASSARALPRIISANTWPFETWYSTPEFAEPASTTLELLSHMRDESLARKTRAALQDPEKWLFLDTETTGLAGGTGTYAFLIGLAWWDAGGLQVEQFFMRDFAEEHSLLHELSQRVAARPVLVTFNGKSFDWPLLENRFTLTRSIAVPSLAAHLDLLHPARALWKLRLGSVRLVELERHVLGAPRLGWHREDDVSSAHIPQFYFDYLRGGPVEPLARVVQHNQMDLRGLAALFCKINELLSDAPNAGSEIESLDLFGLSRFLQRRGEDDPRADRVRAGPANWAARRIPPEGAPRAGADGQAPRTNTPVPPKSGWRLFPIRATAFTPANNWPSTTNATPKTPQKQGNLPSWRSPRCGGNSPIRAIRFSPRG